MPPAENFNRPDHGHVYPKAAFQIRASQQDFPEILNHLAKDPPHESHKIFSGFKFDGCLIQTRALQKCLQKALVAGLGQRSRRGR